MMRQDGEEPRPPQALPGPGWGTPVGLLIGAERAIFSFVGFLLFVAAFVLAVRAAGDIWTLVTGPYEATIATGTAFLDMMLLVLMIVELAYTVTVSLRGTVLAAEPFLIVALIAVIRRMLVITIGDVTPSGLPAEHATSASAVLGAQPMELGILTAVVLALVAAIVLLRRLPRTRGPFESGPSEV
jgi:uncharacterized membrane protein (DUF373 family)